MKKKYFFLMMAVTVAFSIGYGAVADAWPIKGRDAYRGYFLNIRATAGDHVWRPATGPSSCRGDSTRALPLSINTKSSFINFVKCKLNNGNAQERVGAQFIIQTMRGSSKTRPTAADIADWEARINNPAVSVSWAASRSYTVNSFYQGCCGGGADPVDDAFFPASGSDNDTVVFRFDGSDRYLIRRQCANPVGNGNIGALPPAQNFEMRGTTEVNGGTSAEVLPGDTVDFRHSLRNHGTTGTSPTSINWSTPSVGSVSSASGNAGTFTSGQLKRPSAARQTFTVPPSASPGTQYCSRISFSPRTHSGGSGSSTQRCATVQYDYDLEPRIEVTIRDVDGQDVTPDGVAEAGYTIEFEYSVSNNGLTVSEDVTCIYRRATHSGYSTAAPEDTFVPSGANCDPSRTFPRNTLTTIATENVPASAVNTDTTICRSLVVDPASQDGGASDPAQACIPVVAKPYPRVYGGDVFVGGGFADDVNACTANDHASVLGWNRRGVAGFAGAGGQYAVLALNAIRDFSTALGNSGGAPPPRGLAFANTSANVSSGLFGGSFGSAPCIPDYYGEPENEQALPDPNLTSVDGGTYYHNGNLNSLGGNVNPGQRITIYVNGDVFVSSNIVYPGSWNLSNMPRLTVIAQGNIYISPNVSRMDGSFIAQPGDSGGGAIHTCATSTSSLSLDGNLYDTCNSKLVVNGAFIAEHVRLLRTSGTLASSNAGDGAPGGGAAAEVFNFNPTLWIDQPPDTSGESGDYDAIISLPPIL